MMPTCDAAFSDEALLDYWIQASPADETERIEAHLFACGDCARRLEALASLGTAVGALARRGRISGIVSRSILNRMQREGLHVRLYTLAPGERVPCAAFPGDDLLVLSLRADFAGVDAVTLEVTAPDDAVIDRVADVAVDGSGGELLWATPGHAIRRLPTARFRVTITARQPERVVLAKYELDHTSLPD